MTEARFSITRRNSAGDLITARGDTGDELLENFMFLFGTDEANRYFTEMRGLAIGAGGVVLTQGAAIEALGGGAPVSPAGDAVASAALITAAAKKSGKTKEELAGISVDEAKKLISGKE